MILKEHKTHAEEDETVKRSFWGQKIFHHDAVADADVQDGGVFGHVIQAVLIAVVGDTVDKKFVKIIPHRSQNGLGQY